MCLRKLAAKLLAISSHYTSFSLESVALYNLPRKWIIPSAKLQSSSPIMMIMEAEGQRSGTPIDY